MQGGAAQALAVMEPWRCREERQQLALSMTRQLAAPPAVSPPCEAPTNSPPLSAGKMRRVPGQRILFKLKDFKKVYVRLEDDRSKVPAPPAQSTERAELR